MQANKTPLTILVAAAVLAVASAASAVFPLDNKKEMKCALGVSKGLAKFTSAKLKCVAKCWKGSRKGRVPVTDCMPPYEGATRACVADPVKGAEAKAIAAIEKGCVADCPECYGEDCNAFVLARVASIELALDLFGRIIWCDDVGPPDDLNPVEAECQDSLTKPLAKLVSAASTCYDKCVAKEFKGKIPPGGCVPPATDPATGECIGDAESKAAAAIAKVCPDFAECDFVGQQGLWVDTLRGRAGVEAVGTYCGSPSGAYID